jgi:hypothetical protein
LLASQNINPGLAQVANFNARKPDNRIIIARGFSPRKGVTKGELLHNNNQQCFKLIGTRIITPFMAQNLSKFGLPQFPH